jgi:hypothetical protein
MSLVVHKPAESKPPASQNAKVALESHKIKKLRDKKSGKWAGMVINGVIYLFYKERGPEPRPLLQATILFHLRGRLY